MKSVLRYYFILFNLLKIVKLIKQWYRLWRQWLYMISYVMLFQMRAYSVPFWLNVDTHQLQFPELIEHFDEMVKRTIVCKTSHTNKKLYYEWSLRIVYYESRIISTVFKQNTSSEGITNSHWLKNEAYSQNIKLGFWVWDHKFSW